jgi:hypothetical protein
VILIVFLFTSCAPLPQPGDPLTSEEKEKAKKECILRYGAIGAVAGGAVGAAAGALLTRDTRGVVAGAVVGGTLGFAIAWGKCLSYYSDLKSYPVADARETARKIRYNPSQGYVTKIKDFYLNPDKISPGGQVQMNASYYVMAPEERKEVKVTETRIVHYYDPLKKEWKELGSVDQEITAAFGTRKAEGHFELPSNVPEGSYRVALKVSAEGVEDQAMQELTVKKGLAMGPDTYKAQPEQSQVAQIQDSRTEEYGAKAVERAGKERGQLIEVTSKTLNVRQKPSTKAKIIAVIKQGEMYEAIESSKSEGGKWFKIRLEDGAEGWVSGKYISLKE